MTTFITKTGTTNYNKARFRVNDRQKLRIVECSHNSAATAIADAAVTNMIAIPADSIIIGVTVDVSTAQADTDIKVGVDAADDLFFALLPLDAALTTVPPTTVGTLKGQPYYTNVATNVVVTSVGNEINTAILTVRAVYVEMDAQVSVN